MACLLLWLLFPLSTLVRASVYFDQYAQAQPPAHLNFVSYPAAVGVPYDTGQPHEDLSWIYRQVANFHQSDLAAFPYADGNQSYGWQQPSALPYSYYGGYQSSPSPCREAGRHVFMHENREDAPFQQSWNPPPSYPPPSYPPSSYPPPSCPPPSCPPPSHPPPSHPPSCRQPPQYQHPSPYCGSQQMNRSRQEPMPLPAFAPEAIPPCSCTPQAMASQPQSIEPTASVPLPTEAPQEQVKLPVTPVPLEPPPTPTLPTPTPPTPTPPTPTPTPTPNTNTNTTNTNTNTNANTNANANTNTTNANTNTKS